jgi:hypothetical protein
VEIVHPRVIERGTVDRCRPRAVPRAELAGDVAVVAAERGEADVGGCSAASTSTNDSPARWRAGSPSQAVTAAAVYNASPSTFPIT